MSQTSTIISGVTDHHMLPSQTTSNSKRKAADEPNTLMAAIKRTKKDGKGTTSNKRKLAGAEEQPGGLLIVRATPSLAQPPNPERQSAQPPSQPSFQPSLRQTSSSTLPSSQPPPSAMDKPPLKKFRAESQPPPTTSTSRTNHQMNSLTKSRDFSHSREDEVDNEMRALENGVDSSTWTSRSYSATETPPKSRPHSGGINGMAKDKLTDKLKSKVMDVSFPLPEHDTPTQVRNKKLREGAMQAISNEDSEPRRSMSEEPAEMVGSRRRRSSFSSRGKRISSSYQATGVMTFPHTSIGEEIFYKHIDAELPEPERVRQLLIWCLSRATSKHNASVLSNSPLPTLPPLTDKALKTLKAGQDNALKLLAEKDIDISLYGPKANGQSSGSEHGTETLKENQQNITNRNWEVTYGSQIKRAQEEDDAWKRVNYFYDSYEKKTQATLEKQNSLLKDYEERSAKGKDKERVLEEDDMSFGQDLDLEEFWRPREIDVPENLRPALTTVRSILGLKTPEPRTAGRRKSLVPANTEPDNLDAEVTRRLPDVEFHLDFLRSYAFEARSAMRAAEDKLNREFGMLKLNIASRSSPLPQHSHPDSSSNANSGSLLLLTYLPPEGRNLDAPPGPTPRDLLKALSRVDRERPPAKIGDAARRAAREVQRAGESGVAAVGERKLTGMHTPRKTPATPRRGSTPARDRDRDR